MGGGFRNYPLEPRAGAGVGGAPGSTPNAAGAMETEPRQVGVGSRADDGAIALWIAF